MKDELIGITREREKNTHSELFREALHIFDVALGMVKSTQSPHRLCSRKS